MPDRQVFRSAWSQFATGVSILTTIQPDGQVHGMAANGITSVALDPMLVLACVDHSRDTYRLIKDARRFAINILSEEQQPIAEYYAAPPESRAGKTGVSFSFTERGSAIVGSCLSWMDCHVYDEVVSGDHTIFIGEVDELQVNPGRPLIFFDSKYAQLS